MDDSARKCSIYQWTIERGIMISFNLKIISLHCVLRFFLKRETQCSNNIIILPEHRSRGSMRESACVTLVNTRLILRVAGRKLCWRKIYLLSLILFINPYRNETKFARKEDYKLSATSGQGYCAAKPCTVLLPGN